MENETEHENNHGEYENTLEIGEQSIFITGAIDNKFSYLGEFGIGYKHEFNTNLSVKIQAERYTSISKWNIVPTTNKNEFTIQLSYAIY